MTKRRFLWCFGAWCFGAVVLFGAAATSAETITLKGQVTSNNGAPLGNARIEFDPGGYVAVSDRNGRFAVREFIPGSYHVTVREGGKFQTFTTDIESTLDVQVNW